MRAFVKLREVISSHGKVIEKLKEIETKLQTHDEQIFQIMEIINQLIAPPVKPKRQIGFQVKEKFVRYAVK